VDRNDVDLVRQVLAWQGKAFAGGVVFGVLWVGVFARVFREFLLVAHGAPAQWGMGLRWGRWGVVSMAWDISGCVFRVLTGAFDLAAFGPTMFWVDGVHIRCRGNGGLGFRPYGESLLTNARNAGPVKSNQSARPERPAPR